jgi:uncharacterized phage-associated protein
MPGYSPEIANEFLRRAKASGRSLTHMQLQKLVYLAHGWALAVLDQQLATDQVQAWDYGPVYPELYRALRKYGAKPVTSLITYGDYDREAQNGDAEASANLSDFEIAVVDKVYEMYGELPAFKLSALTHEPDSPWSIACREGFGQNPAIRDPVIKNYFQRLGQGGEAVNN